ncbi:MAG: DUF167 domain-containing protein [Coriobacteriia bacterium]|nr:DUF167 domain-containing protein [Coriobacteriia bacterium]
MSARIPVHVTPRSGRDEVTGWRGSELAVRVTAPPEAGKANAAVCKVVAVALGVPGTAVHVVRGAGSRHKTLAAEGVDPEDVRAAFGEPDAGLF